jgi:hypothetical protein
MAPCGETPAPPTWSILSSGFIGIQAQFVWVFVRGGRGFRVTGLQASGVGKTFPSLPLPSHFTPARVAAQRTCTLAPPHLF